MFRTAARTALLTTALAAGPVAGALAQAFPTYHTGDAAEGGKSRSEALSLIMDKGYSNVGTLTGSHGKWTGEATKSGGTVMVTVDKDGKVSSVKP